MDNQKGFTLPELLIALVILSIGLLSLAKMQLVAIKGNSFAQKLTQAVVLTQDKLEDLRSMGYTQVVAASTTSETLPEGFTRTWSKDTSISGTVKVTVTCNWNDVTGASHRVNLSTLIAQSG